GNGLAQDPRLLKPARASSVWPENAYRCISPSVTTSRPAASWSRTASSTARSSIRLNAGAVSRPDSIAARASTRYAGRRRLPTTSLRGPMAAPMIPLLRHRPLPDLDTADQRVAAPAIGLEDRRLRLANLE